MSEKKLPQWVTSWPEWFGIGGNVSVVPLEDYDALNVKHLAALQRNHELEVEKVGMLARLEAAERDGARLDWLETQRYEERHGVPGGNPDYCSWTIEAQAWTVRDAIDLAARSQEQL